jgi:hypothetical protein
MTPAHDHREHEHHIRIHIDQHRLESPNPTTGAALYRLGNIGSGLVLYREITGDREDKVIANGPEAIHLKEDEHFHSGPPVTKEVTIIVNGTPFEWNEAEITYSQVVTLDNPDYPNHPEITYSVKYKNGPGHKPEGTLSPGGSVKVKNGMMFSVSETGQS